MANRTTGVTPKSTYTIAKQSFLNSVVDKIGRQEFSDKAFTNPLARLKKGFIEGPSDIEEIYIARISGSAPDPTGANSLDRTKPTVSVQYHRQNYARQYTTTVQDKEVRKGFLTSGGVNTVSNHIIQSLHSGAEYEEYQETLDYLVELAKSAPATAITEITLPTDSATSVAFTKAIKKTIKRMGDPSTTYSTVENFSKPNELILAIDREIMIEMDVEMLANAFNITKQQLTECTILEIPSLSYMNSATTPKKVSIGAILFDEKAIQIHDTFYSIESVRNAKGKFTNYFLDVEKMFSYSNFVPVAVFQKTAA